ncbi:MAG: DUF6596 domain-containing protein [Aquihabitans sp.]
MTSRSDPPSTPTDRVLADAYRAEWGRLLSLLIARTRRLDLAEDALGEAFVRASEHWPEVGAPASPAGWLYTAAYRLIIGRLRAEAVAGRKAPLLAVMADWTPDDDELDALGDERLALILLCCHPALSPEARSPLALRLVIGTSTEEIARLFLVGKATMAARITRAKKKIVAAGIPLSSPVGDELRARLDEVTRTIYLAFTAGYAPGTGPELLRVDLAGEAVELAAVLHHLVPGSAQVRSLLALLVLQHARRDARVSAGRLVTLPDQDRTLWRNDEIQAGLALLEGVSPDDVHAAPLRIQAEIAAAHSQAVTADATDWTTIAERYAALETLTGSPVVRLNRAVAVAEVAGAHAGLTVLDGLDEVLGGNHRLFAVRADLASRAGDASLARKSFDEALRLCANETEHAHLTDRRNALDS